MASDSPGDSACQSFSIQSRGPPPSAALRGCHPCPRTRSPAIGAQTPMPEPRAGGPGGLDQVDQTVSAGEGTRPLEKESWRWLRVSRDAMAVTGVDTGTSMYVNRYPHSTHPGSGGRCLLVVTVGQKGA